MLQDSLGKKIRFLDFLRDGIRFLGPILTAILLSAFFLVPTAMALHGGREGETTPTRSFPFYSYSKIILDPLSSLCNRTDHTDPDRFDRRTCLEEKRRTDPDLEHDPDSDDSVLFLSAQWRTVHPGQGSDSVSSGFMLSDRLLYAKTTGRSSPALARTSALYSDDHTDIYRKHRIHAVLQPILTCSGRRHHGGMLPALL